MTMIYLSTDSTITTLDIDTTYGCDTGPLVAGASVTCSGTILLPANLSAGTYYVGMVADANNQVVESNEGNNGTATTTTLQVLAAKTSQTISFGALTSKALGSSPFAVSATASSSLSVTFSSITQAVCTVSGSTVTLLSVGTCTIAADQAGNGSYSAAPQVTQSFSITTSTSPSIALLSGWNLAGNSIEAPITVATTFGDATKVNSVWKWIPSSSKWAFYTPTQTDGGAAYATSKGYAALTTINAGEGFWVNAAAAFSVQLPSGTAVQSSSFKPATTNPVAAGGTHALPSGWSLIAVGDNTTPTQFDAAIATSLSTPPTAGQVYTNLTTLWAWDATTQKWYFWAPALTNNGGLANFISSHNYLDFTSSNKTLGPGVGFWLNKP